MIDGLEIRDGAIYKHGDPVPVGRFGGDDSTGWRVSIRIDIITGSDIGRYIGSEFETEEEALAWLEEHRDMIDVYTRPPSRGLTFGELAEELHELRKGEE